MHDEAQSALALSLNQSETYYRRHLPHYQPEGETYHVVFRLAGSLPASVIAELRFQREQEETRITAAKNEEEKAKRLRNHRWKYFERIDKLLDGTTRGPFWLRKHEVAALVDEAIRYRDRKEYDLITSTIMPNHVHLVFRLLGTSGEDGTASRPTETRVRRVADPTLPHSNQRGPFPVTDLLSSLKKYTALRANRILGRRGAFWQDESYDHVIRDLAELDRTVEYVLMNPVKAGLCNDWREWKWSYVKQGFMGD